MTFERLAVPVLQVSLDICDTRSGQYADTYNINLMQGQYVDHVLRLGVPERTSKLYPYFRRLVMVASLVDTKHNRMLGAWTEDTPVDEINYSAFFTGLMGEYIALAEGGRDGTE
jgi:hypothetical protein